MQARVMSTDSPSRTIVLPVTATQPKVAMEQMDQLGIRELVGEGISDFKGSVQGRMRNIEVASARFAGIVVPPGETFSFNAHLGDVVEANGYEDAWVIFGDRTVLGPGGGVCQVSTTLFRAAFWGGYPITERTAHTYRVGWYEQGGQPVGLDATVFAPSVDLKFVNDSPAYLLIQPMVDAKVGTLAFRLYGTRVDRTVMMEGPKIENIVPHGPPVYREDPTLSRGTRKQVDIAHDGADVTIVRIIKRGDQELRRDTFFSHYVPWQAVFLIGTKGG
jgi:vancomycin resistance protein YoaR